jgi:hypothetical protein
MSKKFDRLKTSLIKRTIRSAIMIAGCAIVFTVFVNLSGSTLTEIQKLEREERKLKSKISQLENEYNGRRTALNKHKKLTAENNLRPLELDRLYISNVLSALSRKYFAEDVSIDIGPVEEKSGDPFNYNSGKIITSTVSISYNSPSDIQAFALAEELLKSFSGYLVINEFTVKRNDQIEITTLEKLAKSGKASFIRTTLGFKWLGLRSNEPRKGGK